MAGFLLGAPHAAVTIYARCADELRHAVDDLAKVSRAIERREGPYWCCLQTIKSVADVLAGDVDILPPAEPTKPPAKKKQLVIRDGNVLSIEAWKGKSRRAR